MIVSLELIQLIRNSIKVSSNELLTFVSADNNKYFTIRLTLPKFTPQQPSWISTLDGGFIDYSLFSTASFSLNCNLYCSLKYRLKASGKKS